MPSFGMNAQQELPLTPNAEGKKQVASTRQCEIFKIFPFFY